MNVDLYTFFFLKDDSAITLCLSNFHFPVNIVSEIVLVVIAFNEQI